VAGRFGALCNEFREVISRVNGAELAVEIEAPALRGAAARLGGTGNFYQPQAAALGERFTVVRPTCAGMAAHRLREISIDGYVADLIACWTARAGSGSGWSVTR